MVFFGGYILISGVLLAILNGHRQALFPAVTVNFRDFNSALENWKKLWHADPRSERAGPSSPHCPVAFNAWVIYRVACVRTFRDYSRIKALMGFYDDKASIDEILRTLDEDTFPRGPELIRALIPACQSIQISVKLGMKLLARTAALRWSVEHMLCNFDIGIFLLEWLHSVEKVGIANIPEEEKTIFDCIHRLLFEDGDEGDELPSVRLVTVNYRSDATHVWGITESLVRIIQTVARNLASRLRPSNANTADDSGMSSV